jgi:hypothetical protein
MRLFRLFVAALGLVAFSFAAVPARAGTINVSQPQWTGRQPDRLINLLNRRDCLDDVVAKFSIQFVNQPTGAFEVWSGTGCDQAANRSSTTVVQNCVRVSAMNMGTVNTTVEIHFRDMVAAAGTTPSGDVAECDAVPAVGLQTRTLYFVVFDQNTQMTIATGTNIAWQFKYDVTAPPPPSNVGAQSGDGTLVTTFTAPTGETNLLHYHFYCSPQLSVPTTTGGTGGTDSGGTAGTDTGGTATLGGAAVDIGGTGASAGTDTGGTAGTDATAGTAGTDATAGTAGTSSTPVTADPNCKSDVLVPGQPPPDGAIDCGTIGAQGADGGETTEVLGNDSGYAVAVATEDTVNNIGVLSGLACATPKDITGFYEAYREAGGQAGGGYCSFAPAHQGAIGTALGFLLGACALFVRRRR